MKVFLLLLLPVASLLIAPLQARTWTSSDGRKMEADYISSRDGKVTVQRSSGTRVTFSLEKLSEEDQAWVKEKLASRAPLGSGDEGSPSGPAKTNEYTKQLTGKWERLEDAGLKYRLFGERKLKGTKLYPLVVYLHGRGGDVMTPETPWDAKSFSDGGNYKKRPCFVIAPQCPKNQFWSGENNTNVVKIIETLVDKLPVNQDRIYITGYSMGGYGTFSLVAKEPKLFAAAAPIAGGGNPSTASSMKKVPFRVFHGDADEVVKVEQSQNMVEALKNARGIVEYTEFPGEGHGISRKVYGDEKFHEWMFEQTKGKKAK